MFGRWKKGEINFLIEYNVIVVVMDKKTILVWIIAFFLLSACDKQAGGEGPVIPDPTPLSLDAPAYMGDFLIPSDNPNTVEGVALGRMLFYDSRLSRNNTVSCASCHEQNKAFVDGRPLSQGVFGRSTTKKSMSLVNVLWENRMFWDGREQGLEAQALHPLQDPNEMDMTLEELSGRLQSIPEYRLAFEKAFGAETISPDKIAKALAQFQRTLISTNSRYDRYLRGEIALTPQEEEGMILFFTHPEPSINLRGGNCGDCHLSITTAGSKAGFRGFHNNGLDSEENLSPGLSNFTGNQADRGRFKAPNLRNIMVRAPYMHDGRFTTIVEVLDHYNEHVQMSSTLDVLIQEASNEPIIPNKPIQLKLSNEEKEAIIAFLHTLTDHEFLNNPAFSNPFPLKN